MKNNRKNTWALCCLLAWTLLPGPSATAQTIVGADRFSTMLGSEQTNLYRVSGGVGSYNWSVQHASTGIALTAIEMNTAGLSFTTVTATEAVLRYAPPAAAPTCSSGPSPQYRIAAQKVGPGTSPSPLPFTVCQETQSTLAGDIEIIMVVDVSGSMGDPAVCQCGMRPPNQDEACASVATGTTKMEYLKEKLLVSFRQLRDYFNVPGRSHKIGLVTFGSSPAQPMGASLLPFSDATLTTQMNTLLGTGAGSLSASGATAMGEGLKTAKTMFSAGASAKVILLFTNGMQNVGDQVSLSASGAVQVGGVDFGSDINIIPYAIFTPEGAYTELLAGLANANNLDYAELVTSPYICDVSRPLRQNWVNAAENLGSPKLVHFKTGQLSGPSATEKFTVTEEMDRLSIALSSVGGHSYTGMSIQKIEGGTAVDISAKGTFDPPLAQPSPHRVFSVQFPISGVALSTKGEYQVSFTANRPGLPYDLSVIVDDRGLKSHFFASPFVGAGEPLFLGARLLQSGTPVTNASAKAIVYRPKKRLGNSFAGKKVPGQFIESDGPWGRLLPGKEPRGVSAGFGNGPKRRNEDGAYIKKISISHPTLPSFKTEGGRDIGEEKYVVLMQETDFSTAYEQEIVAEIPLQHQGAGAYSGLFNGTQRAGLYHVRFEAVGTHPSIGAYYRFEESTPLVRFGTPDRRCSRLFALYEQPFVVSMRPVDTEGNLLGPNQVSAISISLSEGSVGSVTDYLDGRYVFPLNLSSNPDPRLTIRIHDRTLYDGPLSELDKKRGFLALHGGLTWPRGVFDAVANAGWFAEGRLGLRRVVGPIGLQLKGGYYQFEGRSNLPITRRHFWGVGGGLYYRKWLGFDFLTGLFLQADLNLAGYKPNSGDWTLGANGGIGLLKPLNHRFSLALQGDYHQLFTEPFKTEFVTVGLGLQWRF